MKHLNNFMEIGMGQSLKKANAETSQYTKHLNPCLGVGIYNLETNESYMGHYTDLMFFDFNEDVNKVKKDFLDSKVLIYTAGGALEPLKENYNKSILQDRRYIEKILTKNFPNAKIKFDWNEIGEVVDFYLDKKIKNFYKV